MLEESINIAEVIPYKSFKEKINIVIEELLKSRHVEIWDELKVIYSSEKTKSIDKLIISKSEAVYNN